jgi:hypothetical protein
MNPESAFYHTQLEWRLVILNASLVLFGLGCAPIKLVLDLERKVRGEELAGVALHENHACERAAAIWTFDIPSIFEILKLVPHYYFFVISFMNKNLWSDQNEKTLLERVLTGRTH